MRSIPARKAILRNKYRGGRGLAFLLPSLAGVAVFSLLPAIKTLAQAFTGRDGSMSLQNFADVLANDAFRQAAANTARFLLVCVPLLLLLSFGLALLVRHGFPNAPLLRAGFLIPFAIPVSSVAMLWMLFFHQNGVANGWITALGGSATDFLNTDKAFYVLVGTYIWRNVGYDMVLFLAGLSTINPALYEASAIDGASPVKQFVYITLPQMKPTLVIVLVLSLLNAFKCYREVYLVSGNYPHGSIYQLQHLFNNWFADMQVEKLSAAAVLVALVILLMILLLQKMWKED